MKVVIVLFSLVLGFGGSIAKAAADQIGQGAIRFASSEPKKLVEEKLRNPKEILSHYKVVLDSGTTIRSPLTLGGTATRPVVKVSLEKCVFFICQKADLDIEFFVQSTSGKCELNADLIGELSRSSQIITENYKQMRLSICFNSVPSGGGELKVNGEVVRSSTFSYGIIQSQLLEMLLRQFPAILEAARKSLSGTLAGRKAGAVMFHKPPPQRGHVPPLF